MTGLVASPLGLLIGLVLGALGGGGSVLAVPVLVYVVGQTPQEATGTSLVIVAVTALGGMVAHGRSGRLHLAVGAGFAAAVVAGSVAGSQVNAALPPRLLLGGFALLMLAAAAGMLRHGGDADAPFGIGDALVRGGAPVRERRAPRDGGAAVGAHPTPRTAGAHRPRAGAADAAGAVPRARPAAATLPRVVIAGVTVGVLTGLFGVGGGFVIVPVLVLVLGIAMRDAVGTSLAVIALSAGTALAARMLGGGDIDWSVAVPFTAAGLAGVVIGTALAARLPARRLARAFAVLLIAVAVVMLLDAAGAG